MRSPSVTMSYQKGGRAAGAMWSITVPCIAFFFFCSNFVVSRCQQSAEHFGNVTQTIEGLLKGYDIRLRPSFGGEPLEIGIEVILASFDSISEVDMDYTITMYLNQYWRDERLQFLDNDTLDNLDNNTIKAMTLTGAFAEKIWVPDTFLANDKNSFLHDITEKNKMVRLYGNGSLVYGMRFTTTLACMMDLHNYPLDHQQCTVEIESYGYTMDDIVLYWLNDRGAVTGVEDVSLPQFSIDTYETINKIEELLTGDYQRLSLIFQLQRNIGYFIFQTYLPSILIVMLSWVSFWINHEATSARVALGITTVLTMTTISNGVRSSLPRISYVKAIDIYLVMCFVFVFAALLEYAAVNYTYWGARAKRKAKRLRERATSVRRTRVEEPPEPMNNSNLEAVELKEVHRMAPAPMGITNSQSFNLELDDGSIETSGFRMAPTIPRPYTSHAPTTAHGYIPSTVVRRRSSSHVPPRRRRLLSNFRQKAKSIKVKIPRVQDVNTIDKYARLMFPLLFIIFNASYWAVYLLT
ncbi:gamma-aminobutyric acid receptor subunit beta isoform X2 [Aplysia californica]|uniref:Gamma-aminobutyric acid receptor subunit beta isoform X2 n=1 Tax=Aplysia californica TaxID=6500 RepID=A0ABM1VYJ1_APLCA|nr:gamma-aminobutyric acid receptor subunit beta isoform X2 [Aplysia californica]